MHLVVEKTNSKHICVLVNIARYTAHTFVYEHLFSLSSKSVS